MSKISIILGAKKITAAAYDIALNKVASAEAVYTSKEDAAIEAAALAKKLIREKKLNDVESIGLAVASCIGCPVTAAQTIADATGLDVNVDTMINAMALGEAYLGANDASSIILLRIGDKVESSIVIDHKIFAGFDGLGGNLAHMVIDNGGYACKCGREGCFEAYVNKAGIKQIAADAGMNDAENVTLESMFAAAKAGCEKAQAAKTFYIEHLASAVTDIINLFQPHQLVILGQLTALGDDLMQPMMEIVLRDQYTRHSPNQCKVRIDNYGHEAALVGALLLDR